MKTRTSHVSNSSTCSFIFIGFDVSKMTLDEDKIFEDGNYAYMDHTENGSPDDETKLLGYDIKRWEDNEGIDTQVLDPAEWAKKFDLEEVRKSFGIPSDIQPKIYIGTRMC